MFTVTPPAARSAQAGREATRFDERFDEVGGERIVGPDDGHYTLRPTPARQEDALVARRLRSHAFPLLVALATVGLGPSAARAQATSNPIPTSAPLASWSLVLEEVVTIPDSAGQPPRLEQLVHQEATGLSYVIDQRGFIYTFDPTLPAPTASLFLDLAAAVGDLVTGNESGVRSLAFHPDFADPTAAGHRKLYLTLSRTAASTPVGSPAPVVFGSPIAADHYTVVSEWTLLPDDSVDLGSYRELMRISQPFPNHDAGHLGFDPTAAPGFPDYGKLYVAVGDGGSSGDPFGLAQDVDATPAPYPHGKILRIDPLASGVAPYGIPSDNPFAGVPDRVAEAWAWGLRNPHQFGWDVETGRMYVSDIGQGVVEEISLVHRAANLGWNDREGAFTYTSTSSVSPLPAGHPTDPYTYPVAQYDHSGNGISASSAIVGGGVYRGSRVPQLRGLYFFADFASNPGPIFAVDATQLIERDDFANIASLDDGRLAPFVEVPIRDGGVDKDFRQVLRDASGNPGLGRTDTRFGIGADGDLYVLNKRDGVVRRVAGTVGLPEVPVLPAPAAAALALALGFAGTGLARRRRGLTTRREPGTSDERAE